jgi:hypothetical protein
LAIEYFSFYGGKLFKRRKKNQKTHQLEKTENSVPAKTLDRKSQKVLLSFGIKESGFVWKTFP